MNNLYIIIDEYGAARNASKLDSGDWVQLKDGYLSIYRLEAGKFQQAVDKDIWEDCPLFTNTNDVDPTKD